LPESLAIAAPRIPCTSARKWRWYVSASNDNVFQLGQFTAADVNSDRKLDLVFADGFANSQSSGSFSQIYFGNGDGTFSAAGAYVSSFQTGTGPDGSVVIADFNGDGKPDIASSGGILLGNGDGTFQGIPLVTLNLQPVDAVAGDFEKNGKPDVAVISPAEGNGQTSYLYILHNSGRACSRRSTRILSRATASSF